MLFAGIISMVLSFGLIFAGCGDGDPDDYGNPDFAKIDITRATNLFVAPASGSRTARDAGGPDKLFKVTESGAVEEVKYLDKDGEEVSVTYPPSAIYNVDDDYTIIVFNYNSGYLVRKSDGAVFSLANVGQPQERGSFFGYINQKVIQQDSAGNIYYKTYGYGANWTPSVVKIDISNPANLTKTSYIELPNNNMVDEFILGLDGHAFYSYQSTGGGVKRLQKAGGGFVNLPEDMSAWWIAPNGTLKYHTPPTSDPDLDMNISAKITTVAGDFPQDSWLTTDTTLSYINIQFENYRIEFSDRLLFIGRGYPRIFEVENPTDTPREFAIPGITTIKLVDYSDNYYYLAGTNNGTPVLLKVDPATNTATPLLSDGYDIYTMTVSADDVVTFNAERMSDGAKVIGQVSATGTVEILDATLNSEVTILTRIR